MSSAVPQAEPLEQSGTAPYRNFVIVAVTIFFIFVLRKPDCLLNPQFWAEDGTLFFRDQLVKSFFHALGTPYQGYFQPLGRVVAAFSSLFPVRYAPLSYDLSALTIDSVCCAMFALPRYRTYISSDWMRCTLCLIVVSAIHSAELVGNLANSQWYVLLGGILLVAQPPDAHGLVRRCLWLLLAIGIGLCMPILVIVIPIGIYRLLQKRTRAGWFTTAMGLGGLLQSAFAVFSRRGIPLSRPSADAVVFALFMALSYKILLQVIMGIPWVVRTARAGYMSTVFLTAAISSSLFTWLWLRIAHEERRRVLAASYLIIAATALPLIVRPGLLPFASLAEIPDRGERYFFLGSCLVTYLVALGLERGVALRSQAWGCTLLILIFAGGIYGNFRISQFADLHWKNNAAQISSWRNDKKSGKPTPEFFIPVNPPGWFIELPASPGKRP